MKSPFNVTEPHTPKTLFVLAGAFELGGMIASAAKPDIGKFNRLLNRIVCLILFMRLS